MILAGVAFTTLAFYVSIARKSMPRQRSRAAGVRLKSGPSIQR